MKIADAQKDVDKDRDALENAPIRTGQRQDARDDYFDAPEKARKAHRNAIDFRRCGSKLS